MQAPIVVAREDHRDRLEEQLRAVGVKPRSIQLEPFGRNTAPSVAVAAFGLIREGPGPVMLVLPADHDIPDDEEFSRAVRIGMPAALSGRLVVFGIEAQWPDTGCGYVERGEPLAGIDGCCRALSFVEKPQLEIARRFADSGRHYWNSGVFLFRAVSFLAELRRLQPQLASACEAAADTMSDEDGRRQIDPRAFARCRAVSVGRAVLEVTDTAAVVPAAFRWSDVGNTERRDHRRVHRPWGYYEDIDSGERFRVKRITVNPGALLSLQLHHHRAEHWVVVKGTARVTRGDESMLLTENQSAHIPTGTRHRLENPGKIPLEVIEVQSGAYLAEDDIVRIEDAYHRV
jgi:mannose-6-phosphate isomerase-like protein (cupin superfamily)